MQIAMMHVVPPARRIIFWESAIRPDGHHQNDRKRGGISSCAAAARG
jgi:hypothetical protein